MTRTKEAAQKKSTLETTEETFPKKVLSPIDIEEGHDTIEGEEKPEIESPFGPEGEDDLGVAGEEISLDSEDLNPFGDKWEE